MYLFRIIINAVLIYYVTMLLPWQKTSITYGIKMAKKANNSNISDLHKELQDAVQADKLYWLRNDAKIRAVTTAQTYEEFRNRVEAAHLSPLTREDKNKSNEDGRTSWNRGLNQ